MEREQRGEQGIFDVVGIGFGPSNLSLAVALHEHTPTPRAVFLEARERFGWHPGMMLDGAKVQNSFVKDLVTLRNPASPFTFIAYLKAKGRLHKFINLRDPHPTRWEFNEYFRWVAGHFERLVHYGCRASKITPNVAADGAVDTLTVTATGARGEPLRLVARSVVLAPGGRPNMLPGVVPASARVLHSAYFMERIAEVCPDRGAPVRVAVVGGGQSGAEIVQYLHHAYPRATVSWIISDPAPRPADDTPFVNDTFLASEVDRHYQARQGGEAGYHQALRNSNYGVSDAELLHAIYRLEYDGAARGEPRLDIMPRSRLRAVEEQSGALLLSLDGRAGALGVDVLVLATGYDRRLPVDLLEEVLPFFERDAAGEVVVERGYKLASRDAREGMRASVFVQGLCEPTHGLGDTLFPVMPFRSAEIAGQVAQRARSPFIASYPPARHVEARLDRLHAVMRRYPLATFISKVEGRLAASHVPLIFAEDIGDKGGFFGHLDANNPQAATLEEGEILAVFQGPSAYISPHVYETRQLPTWNFVTVQVRGIARVLRRREDVVAGLVSIPPHADQRPGAYRLDPRDERIDQLIGGIVGFRVEITGIEGRFKLSQDRLPGERVSAKDELARAAARDERELLTWLHDAAEPSGGAPEVERGR